ncbi:hypothetical protein H5410_041403 [Solanum commersonii]|uniref:Uncharacterized protein n=1 Tax=Solanum commersonii TaxID=4109 RepID=A0A9J5XRR4_SOLCO|nr:hypothetical protein H5410_041403 [Solanum commersonii]
MLTLTNMNTMYDFTYRFANIFQSTIVSVHLRSKSFFQEKDKAQRVCKQRSHTHKVADKSGTMSNYLTLFKVA